MYVCVCVFVATLFLLQKGNIGSQDVSDCMAALDMVLAFLEAQDGKSEKRRKVAVFGGSHGGFLGAHMIGQHGDRFECAILRNPVVNLGSMVYTTDIPDWCFIETFGCAIGKRRCRWDPRPEDVQAMYDKSPIKHIDTYSKPTLFLIGERDKRVPMSNPLQFISALSARGVVTRTFRFPHDCHPLHNPQTEYTCVIEAMEWIRRYCA